MSLSIAFHKINCAISCSKKIVLGDHALPRAQKYHNWHCVNKYLFMHEFFVRVI
jgi:hypothetical protein